MARGGKRAGAGRKTISKVQRLIIAAHVETELKSGTVADDPKVASVRRHQEYLQRISLKERRRLRSVPQQSLRWIQQQLRGRRIGAFRRPSSREIMRQEARKASEALGVEITWQQVRRWLTWFRKTKERPDD